jgi:DNA-binding transcriptional LysR family regulator
MQSWDNLRYFLALHRHGRLIAAARALHVDHTTVGRRVKELETSLNTKLFEKRDSGFEVTTSGKSLLVYAEAIEKTVMGIETGICVDSENIKGSVRISSPEDFGSYFLATRLPELLSKYQELEIDLLSNEQDSNISRREIDIIITTNRPDSGRLVVKRLGEYRLGLFASKCYFEKHKSIKNIEDLKEHKLISCVDDKSFDRTIKNSVVSECKKISFKSRNMTAQYKAAQNGYGLCLMPCFMKEEYTDFIPVLEDQVVINQTLWLVVNEDMRYVDRIKKTSDFISDTLALSTSIFSGGQPNIRAI